MKLTVYGSGCAKCQQLIANTEAAARRLGLEYQLEKVTDVNAIIDAGNVSEQRERTADRLQHRDHKPRYGEFQPRQLSILARNLAHPALAGMRAFVREQTPIVFEAKA